MYSQHCEPNFGCKNLEQKVFTVWDEQDGKCIGPREKVTQNKIKLTMRRMKQLNGWQTERK